MTTPETPAGGLTTAQREALVKHLGGGMAGYLQRLRWTHGPVFATGRSDDVIYTGCRCGEVACPFPRLLVHMDDLIRAYELKVQDFARETTSVAAAVVQARAEDQARIEAEALRAALSGITTHNGQPVSPKNLRWAATHEALCRSYIFDVLMGLADSLTATEDGDRP